MSVATVEDARIDSRLAAILVASVFSFALGIFVSLMVTNDRDEAMRASDPCPSRCPRLILMNYGASSECEPAPIGFPSAYGTPDLIAAR